MTQLFVDLINSNTRSLRHDATVLFGLTSCIVMKPSRTSKVLLTSYGVSESHFVISVS